MTQPDYPLLAVPGYELYQLAHIATFVAEGLAQQQRNGTAGDRPRRRPAARQVTGARASTGSDQGLSDPTADEGRCEAALTEAGRRSFRSAARAIGPVLIEDDVKLVNRAGPVTARPAHAAMPLPARSPVRER
jgi:hypothetical protein